MPTDERSYRADQAAIDCVSLVADPSAPTLQVQETPMPIRRIAVAAILAAALAALPLTRVRAQYYPPCNPFPLSWPFCIAGAAVGTAAAIATAPFYAVAGAPYYYYGQPYYYDPAYSYPVRRHRKRRHYRQ